MGILGMFAGVGLMFNDLFAILSLIGSTILFFGAFSDKPLRSYREIGNYSILGLIFGAFFQLCMVITGVTSDKIGILIRMTPATVNGIFGFSFLLLLGRWWIRKNRYKLM